MYSVEEAAELLSLSRHTLARDARLGKIAARRYGRRVLIPRDEILRLAGQEKDVDGSKPGPRAA
jgi:excisionase family DNA binding protein